MSTLKVQNIRDYTGTSGFTLSSGSLSTVGRLIVNNMVINGTMSGSTVSILPSQTGNSGRILTTTGSNPQWTAISGNQNIFSLQVFGSSGTWNKPSGVRYIKVQVVGGGGGGSGHGESGGSGGYSERVIDVQSVSSVSVTVSG